MLTRGFYEWSARAGGDYFPPARFAPARPPGIVSRETIPDVGRRRPESFLAGETLAAPADHHVHEVETGEREQIIAELIDLLGTDETVLMDALADLDATTPAQRGDSPAARVEGRKAALEAGFRSRGMPLDPALIDTLARDAVRHSSGWRESAPGGSVALAER